MVTIALVPYCLWRAYRKKKVEMSLWNLFLVALAVLPFYIYNLWFNNQFNLLHPGADLAWWGCVCGGGLKPPYPHEALLSPLTFLSHG